MKKVEDIKQIAEEVSDNVENPKELSKIVVYVGALQSYYTQQLKPIKLRKSTEWLAIKRTQLPDGKYPSYRVTEMEWRKTQAGMRERELEYDLKSLDKILDSIKQAGYLSGQEIKLQS